MLSHFLIRHQLEVDPVYEYYCPQYLTILMQVIHLYVKPDRNQAVLPESRYCHFLLSD